MEKHLLTVAIPTYNRPETLQKTLETLKWENSDLFTVLVSDDSSTSGVEDVVRAYQETMPNLRYSRNAVNLGFSGNVARLYELANTRYVWFLCDDDTINKGAVTEIVCGLEKYEPVIAIFNCTWDDSFGRRLTAGVSSDIVYSDINAFDRYDVLMRMTFLSILVVEKRLPVRDITNNSAYKDNVFIQLTLGLNLLSNKFNLCEISSTILHRNVGFKYGEFMKFTLVDPLKAVHLTAHKFNNRKFIYWSIRQLPKALQLYLAQKIGLFSYSGQPTQETLRVVKLYYGSYTIPILFIKALCKVVPAFFIRGIYMLMLIQIHGSMKKGVNAYRTLADRATSDLRETGFTSYR